MTAINFPDSPTNGQTFVNGDVTYTWANAEQTTLKRDDGAFIPTDPANRDYAEFLNSGAAA